MQLMTCAGQSSALKRMGKLDQIKYIDIPFHHHHAGKKHQSGIDIDNDMHCIG